MSKITPSRHYSFHSRKSSVLRSRIISFSILFDKHDNLPRQPNNMSVASLLVGQASLSDRRCNFAKSQSVDARDISAGRFPRKLTIAS